MAGKRKVYENAMRMAADFIRNGDWTAAIKAYRAALEEFPDDVEAWLGASKSYLEAGQLKTAVQAVQRTVQLAPDRAAALLLLADVRERLGQLDEAAQAFVLAGNVLARERRLMEAVDLWERAVNLVPDHLEAHNYLAQGFARLGQTGQAVRQLIHLASLYQRRGDGSRAMQQLRGALHLAPGNHEAEMALAALQRGEPVAAAAAAAPKPAPAGPQAEAEDYFLADFVDEEEEETGDPAEQAQQRALADLADILFEDELPGITVSKLEVDALVSQAIDLQTRGQVAEAIEDYRQLLDLGLTRPSVHFNLGILYYAENRFDEARRLLEKTLADDAYRLGAHYALGRIYRAQRQPSEALRQFLEAVKLVDLKTVSATQAGRLRQVYERMVDSLVSSADAAKVDLFIKSLTKFFSGKGWARKAVEARRRMDSLAEDGTFMSLAEYLETPETPIALTAMALTTEYMRRNMLMTAAEECYRAIQKVPSYLPIHMRLAEILLKQEHTEQAIAKYLTVADVYQIRGQENQAINVYRRVLKLAPMDLTVRARLIDMLSERREVDEAMEQYLALADAYYQLAQVDQSLEKYNEALRLAPQASMPRVWQVEILHRIGDICNQRVDWARACAAYEELIRLAPDDQRARQALIDLYFKQSRTDDAIRSLDELLRQYHAQDAGQKMLTYLQDAIQIWPEEMALRQRLGAVYAQLGRKQEAIAEYDALGEMQLEQGLREEAAKTVQTIIELGPEDVEGYRQLLAQIRGGV